MQLSGLTSRSCRLTPWEGQASRIQTERCEHQKLSEWFGKEKNLFLVPGFERRIAQSQFVISVHVFLFRFSKNKVALVKIEPLCLYSFAIQSKVWQFSGGQRFTACVAWVLTAMCDLTSFRSTQKPNRMPQHREQGVILMGAESVLNQQGGGSVGTAICQRSGGYRVRIPMETRNIFL